MAVYTQVYKERVFDVTLNCAREAAKTGVKRFIEVSTAQVYDCDKVMACQCVHSSIALCVHCGLIPLPNSDMKYLIQRVPTLRAPAVRTAEWIHGHSWPSSNAEQRMHLDPFQD